jgi:NADPH-dependent 2,4-dienoyl-CoA reductase/sulfur reductase-like enzyme
MIESTDTVVVVGASLAGSRAAEELRSLGHRGRVVLIGAEEHQPYDRPPLSKQFLAGSLDEERIALRPRGRYEDLGVELRLGLPAAGLDLDSREVVLEGGDTIGFDGLVIATGASPRSLRLAGEADGVHLLRTLDDAHAIRRRIEQGASRAVVVGAGFIGSEVASTLRSKGLQVSVVEALDVPLVRALGKAMGGVCGNLHQANGVELLTSVRPERVEKDGRGLLSGLRLEDGRLLGADVVVVGVGVVPETRWLQGSGIEIEDGVVTDEALFAADRVVAAGDLARWRDRSSGGMRRIEHWTNAAEQGVHAARSLVQGKGRAEAYSPVPYFWSDQYGLKIQVLGWPGPDDEVEVLEGSPEEFRFVAVYSSQGKITAALGFGMPRRLMGLRPLVETAARVESAREL